MKKLKKTTRRFNSKSTFNKKLISEKELLKSVKEAEKEYKNGKAIKANFLADFL